MARIIRVGEPEELYTVPFDCDVSYTVDDYVVITPLYPALYTGVLDTFQVNYRERSGGYIRFSSWVKNSETSFTLHALDSIGNIAIGAGDPCDHYIYTGRDLNINAGEYLGMCVHNGISSNPIEFENYGGVGLTGHYYDEHSCTSSTGFEASTTERIGLYGEGLETVGGGTAPDACQSSGYVYLGNTYVGYGSIKVNDFDFSGSPYTVLVDLIYPWGGGQSDVIAEGGTEIYEKPSSDPKEYWSVTCTNIYNGTTDYAEFTDCWYRESDTYYVKTTGSDTNFGTNWANAFATITKSANVSIDGGRVYIGYGTYNSETDIVPDNFNSKGIRYYPTEPDSGQSYITEYATEDSYVSYNNPTNNYGTGDFIYTIGSAHAAGLCRTLIKFDLDDVNKYGKFIISLTKTTYDPYSTMSLDFHVITSSWDGSTVTWNNQPTYDSNYVTYVMPASNGEKNIDISSIIDYSSNEIGILIKPTTETVNTGTKLYSTEYGYGPELRCYGKEVIVNL